jgi:hypothetical protein
VNADPWRDLAVAQLTRSSASAPRRHSLRRTSPASARARGTPSASCPARTCGGGGSEKDATSSRQRNCEGHFAAETKPKAHRLKEEVMEARSQELVDETGIPILYTSGHNVFGRATECISFPDQRWLRFWVRGTHQMNAIMTAVDQAGNRVARYRITGKGVTTPKHVEITVHPDQKLTDELVLAIAISAPWIGAYFQPGAGG